MTIEVIDKRLLELVDADAELEPVGSGFRFSEGPLWVPDGADPHLLFSDVPGNSRYRWTESEGAQLLASPTELANGMTLDLDGRLVVCEGLTGAVARIDRDGGGTGRQVIAAAYEGRRLNSPNDVVVRSDGAIYFTDPWWLEILGYEVERELDFQGVYRVPPGGGHLELLLDDMDFPNGLCFAPGEAVLYVNDSSPGRIRAFDVTADGGLANDRVLADGIADPDDRIDGGHVDGMKCDERGNIWVTGPGGVWVLAPDGTHLGVIHTEARVGNLHWGGPNWSWLFICSSDRVLRLSTNTAARREKFMR